MLVGWCLVCQRMEPVMLDSVTRRPACAEPQPERRKAEEVPRSTFLPSVRR